MPVGGGEWTPITNSTTDSTYAVSYFPGDDRVLFTRDQGGNELNHLYVRTPDGQEQDLTPGDEAQGGSSSAGRRDRHGPSTSPPTSATREFFDLYRYDAKTYERTMLFKNDGGYQPAAISADGRWIALAKPKTTADSDIYLWNAATKKRRTSRRTPATAPYSTADVRPGLDVASTT